MLHSDLTKYLYTDMAGELLEAEERQYAENHRGEERDGVMTEEETRDGIRSERVYLTTEEAAKRFGKERGCYTTVFAGDVTQSPGIAVTRMLLREIRHTADRAAPGAKRILIAGLGNREMTCDALGPMAVDQITPSDLLACLSPGVRGQTGMESCALVRAAAQVSGAELVVLIDALAARSTDWLCRTIQLSDRGIAPGGGVKNKRSKIDFDSVGVPVMSIGVPTVIDTATMLYDALEQARLPGRVIEEAAQRLSSVMDSALDTFVTPRDTDALMVCWSRLLGNALLRAFRSEA